MTEKLVPKKKEEVPMIVHRLPVDEYVEGVGMVRNIKEYRIPLADNAAFEIEHGLA